MIQIAETVDDNTTILTLSGRLDIHARKPFQMAMKNIHSVGCQYLTLDLSRVTFIDSSAIGLLILANRTLNQTHTKLSLLVSPGVILDSLKLMNIDKLMPIRSL